ncbi:ENTH/VHS family protein [Striga asiatica]|uniref:ENTH/VHS family protein n=1 Tax=Striga asiatica TaxID=4170 RepID=A0A5A7PWL3_STRAF|nr:ENTH/VHS family protein [Striga asiatica]
MASIKTNINSGGANIGFHELKKQASFFFKEKIKSARLALTDVTPAQLLAEEATNGDPGCPDARTLKMISKAAFEVDDYWRIVDILHRRLVRFEKMNWRPSYKALIVVEHLLTQGPERVAEEFQIDSEAIKKMESFQYIDDQGFNWGLNVRKKCERVLKLLEKGPLLKEEREKARKISRGIQGFGSFCSRNCSPQDTLREPSFARSYSESNHHEEDLFPVQTEKPLNLENSESVDTKENWGTDNNNLLRETSAGSTNEPLLGEKKNNDPAKVPVSNTHPFDDQLTAISLLSAADEN